MNAPQLTLLEPPAWEDYALLDSGEGQKLERFGPYLFIRPESQAVWRRALLPEAWAQAHAVFEPKGEHGGWRIDRPMEERWEMRFRDLKFWAQPTPFRHTGVFPEQASHWDWADEILRRAETPPNVLNLFGYTGVFSLVAAHAGATVTHLDASKKSIGWARENQELSRLSDKPIRWIIDDAVKFVEREARRGRKYDGFIIDPPKYGRGPKGEVWDIYESLPLLLRACRELLSDAPSFVVITTYAIRISAVSVYYILQEMMDGYGGELSAGELCVTEQSAGRKLSTSLFARWNAG